LNRGIEQVGKRIGEVGEVVTFGALVANSDVVGNDSEAVQLAAELGQVDLRFSIGDFRLRGATVQAAQVFDELGGGEAGGVGLGEDGADRGRKARGLVEG